jgi:CheY-like chemotaxis protein
MVKKIVVIDDDDIFIFLARNTLMKLNPQLDFQSFADGERALNYFKEKSVLEEDMPEIILLDINMPYLDGWGFMNEFNKIMLNINKKVLVYIASSSNSKSDYDKAFNLQGIAGYVVKPIIKTNFKNLIESYPEPYLSN